MSGQIRETGVRARRASAPERPARMGEGWDDAAVAPEKVAAYLRDIRKLLDEVFVSTDRSTDTLATDASHMRITFDLVTETRHPQLW